MIVRFVDIGEIVCYHCLSILVISSECSDQSTELIDYGCDGMHLPCSFNQYLDCCTIYNVLHTKLD